MSTGKRLIYPAAIIGSTPSGINGGKYSGVSGDMSQASITSLGFNVQNMDNIGIQIVWTGSPVGTLALNGSGYDGGYLPLPGFSVNAPSGSAGGTLLDIVPTSMFWLQLVYTKTSGTGSLNAWFFAKAN